jgi:aconitase A
MVLFVLEMNNTTNKIVGVGMVKNQAICNKYKVYYNISYNRYVYLGRKRISREDMTEEEEEIMKVFDTMCFKGASNMKRGQGLTTFPVELLYKVSKIKDLVDFVTHMFKRRQ